MTDVSTTPRPADRWRELLQQSAVPQEIIDTSPEPDATLEPERFRWRPEEDATQPMRPSRRRALEALPEGGTVLDVGVGGGASSLGLVPKPGLIVGVDPLEGMLESFRASAADAGVACKAVLGNWPEVADQVQPADVAVCHHAIYRVTEVEDFLTALTQRARQGPSATPTSSSSSAIGSPRSTGSSPCGGREVPDWRRRRRHSN